MEHVLVVERLGADKVRCRACARACRVRISTVASGGGQGQAAALKGASRFACAGVAETRRGQDESATSARAETRSRRAAATACGSGEAGTRQLLMYGPRSYRSYPSYGSERRGGDSATATRDGEETPSRDVASRCRARMRRGGGRGYAEGSGEGEGAGRD